MPRAGCDAVSVRLEATSGIGRQKRRVRGKAGHARADFITTATFAVGAHESGQLQGRVRGRLRLHAPHDDEHSKVLVRREGREEAHRNQDHIERDHILIEQVEPMRKVVRGAEVGQRTSAWDVEVGAPRAQPARDAEEEDAIAPEQQLVQPRQLCAKLQIVLETETAVFLMGTVGDQCEGPDGEGPLDPHGGEGRRDVVQLVRRRRVE